MVRHLAKLNQVRCPHACLPPTQLFTVTLTTALSSSTRAAALPAGQRLKSNAHTHTHVARTLPFATLHLSFTLTLTLTRHV